MNEHIDDPTEHEDGEDQEVQPGHGLGQALIVARRAAEAGRPGEATFNDPATRPIGRFPSASLPHIVHLLLRCCPPSVGLRT